MGMSLTKNVQHDVPCDAAWAVLGGVCNISFSSRQGHLAEHVRGTGLFVIEVIDKIRGAENTANMNSDDMDHRQDTGSGSGASVGRAS